MGAHRYVVRIAGEDLTPAAFITNTLCFNHTLPGIIAPTDLESLAEDLAAAYRDHWFMEGGAREIRVKVYEFGPPPQYPLAETVVNEGSHAAWHCPGEVALCLSFYSVRNVPRHRGRLYLPVAHRSSGPGANPGLSIMTDAIALAQAFGNLGGVNVDWSVWSTRDSVARKATDVWVDDEWDTVRSRGIPPKVPRATWTTDE